MRPFIAVLLLTAPACDSAGGRLPNRPPDRPPRDDTDGPPDPPRDPLLGVSSTGWDPRELEAYGLVHGTWEMTREHQGGYRTTQDGNPRFHVVARPRAFEDGRPRPLLLWLHGGVAGVVGDPGTAGIPCTQERVDELAENAVSGHPYLLTTLAARDWIMVIPESTWCDLWAGLGEDDPVNPAHASLVHVDWTLAAIEAGLGGLVPDPANIYAWGTSIGGIGVWPVSHGIEGWGRSFAGAISDSGPVILTRWYLNEWGGTVLDATMGGPAFGAHGPTEFFPNYQRVDAPMLVEDLGFRVPMFLAYNALDDLCPGIHGATMVDVLNDNYRPEGARYFIHDWNHHGPGERGHTQTAQDNPPYIYTTEAAAAFLSGRNVAFIEAEDTCTTCTIDAEEPDGDWTAWVARYSGGAAARRQASEGPGTLFFGQISASLPREIPIALMLVLDAESLDGCADDEVAVTIHLGAGDLDLGTFTVDAGDFAGAAGTTMDAHDQLGHTTIVLSEDLDGDGDADGLPPGAATALAIATEACGDLWFDGYWALW